MIIGEIYAGDGLSLVASVFARSQNFDSMNCCTFLDTVCFPFDNSSNVCSMATIIFICLARLALPYMRSTAFESLVSRLNTTIDDVRKYRRNTSQFTLGIDVLTPRTS